MSQTTGGNSWDVVIVAAAFVVQFISFGISCSIGVYNIQLLQHFNNDAVTVSLITSLNLGIFLGTGPIASYLMTKFEHRTIAIVGAVLSSLGLVVIAIWQNLVVMCVFYGVVTGLGYCLVYIPSHVLSGLYFEERRSLATGVATSGSGLGSAVFPIIIESLISFYGWRQSLLVVAGINLHLIPIAALLRPLPKAKQVALGSRSQGQGQNILTSQLIGGRLAASCADIRYEEVHNDQTCESTDILTSKIHLMPTDKIPEIHKDHRREGTVTERDREDKKSRMSVHENGRAITTDAEFPECKPGEAGNALVMFDTGSVGMLDAADLETTGSLLAMEAAQSDAPCNGEAFGPAAAPVIHSYRVFKDFGFNVYFINNIMWNLGLGVYAAFAPMHFTLQGMSQRDAATLVMILGFGDFVGGIIGGAIGNMLCCNRLAVFTVVNIVLGVAMMALPLVEDYWMLAALNLFLGLTLGVILGLLIILCVDILGPQNLGTALGYLLLSNGIGIFIGPPLAGALYDASGTYVSSFYMAGGLIIIGGLVMILIPLQARLLPSLSLASRQGTETVAWCSEH